ncbi:3-methyl-2-oxobutanoate hydroxymethyltransferase [Maioricimonas rarisocia]|uniref:3-methyl-2-oxobutanoate hydroxymethyltransferase n=1 Tax=Maioricimonas rarisocia TaxID=2528026 RepID=A0A517ZCP3_9PLAN|nr:3-methyl-2-oxobutanoate hydroxymethyltransferase [Maioricimonas rarisocia]QDU40268.1 3-methyl-2-oxobutanoate hydroxymethyltransferase [Maioricimonas rarisocia]
MDETQKAKRRPMTVPRFVRAKADGRKLTMLTAYDYLWAQMLDEAGVDSLLVGDTLGMVVQGRDTTLPVTLDQIIYHGEMVARAVRHALVIVDLPFLTYQVSPQQAIESAGRILKETGATAVKLEGGVQQAKTIEALTNADIPVMAHVGLRPQAVRMLGRMSAIQRESDRLLADAKSAADAGAFGIVLELIPGDIATAITEAVAVPTIGIGAGPGCDGQVLVTPDMFGMTTGFEPKFLKRYADLRSTIQQATREYVSEVREGQFPDAAHTHQ